MPKVAAEVKHWRVSSLPNISVSYSGLGGL